MIQLTLLNEYVCLVNLPEEESEDYDRARHDLKKCLGQLSHITGYQGPRL